ncbi:MAG: sulfatase [Candidatus Binatia bacterium]|nr:sulfatase [Candidatus Binatia bacterium]
MNEPAGISLALRRVLVLTIVVVAAALAVVTERRLHRAHETAAPGGRPNVLLISIDTLRADHLGAYGYERDTSPNIDELAAEGVTFRQAISPSGWTLPTHVTLLTSIPPEKHGVAAPDRRLNDDVSTLASVMRDAGYDTAGFVSGPYLGGEYGYSDGFDTYNEEEVRPRGRPSMLAVTSPGLTKFTTEWLSAWKAKDGEKPFFVFLHMWDVHDAYAPPPEYVEMFDPDFVGDMPTSEKYPWDKKPRQAPREFQHLLALYDGEIRYTDEHLGRVFDKLRSLGVYDDTLIILTSDHGEEFFEHGIGGHSRTLVDQLVNVPLIMRYPPRIRAGMSIENQVRLMDVGPTLLGLAGVDRPEGFGLPGPEEESRASDLSRWIAGAAPIDSLPELPVFLETTGFGNRRIGIRTDEFKLIHVFSQTEKDKVVVKALYRLPDDPGEKKNLLDAGPAPDDAADLEAKLVDWDAHWGARAKTSHTMKVNPDLTEQLRALGYVE